MYDPWLLLLFNDGTGPGQDAEKDDELQIQMRCGGRRDRWVGCARRFVLVGIRRLAEW
jgi:hypothetical protein